MKKKEQFSIALWDRLQKDNIPHTFETREGSKIIQLTQFNSNVKQPIVGHDTNDHNIEQWGVNGNYNANGSECGFDLFIVWEEEQLMLEGWLNIYPYNHVNTGIVHIERHTADKLSAGRLACVPVSIPYTKGEGLNNG